MDRFSRESIIQDVLDMGFSHAGLADVGTLKPLEAVREMCAVDKCHAYGKNWSCPPGCGTIPECEAEMRSYDWGVLVQITQDLEDDLDFEGWKEAGKRLRDLSVSLHEELVKRYPQVLALGGAGCDICKTCTYPDAPCRFPEEMYHSLEGYGFNVSELAGQAGIRYMNGPSTVTFLGAVLYGKPGNTGEDSEGQT